MQKKIVIIWSVTGTLASSLTEEMLFILQCINQPSETKTIKQNKKMCYKICLKKFYGICSSRKMTVLSVVKITEQFALILSPDPRTNLAHSLWRSTSFSVDNSSLHGIWCLFSFKEISGVKMQTSDFEILFIPTSASERKCMCLSSIYLLSVCQPFAQHI